MKDFSIYAHQSFPITKIFNDIFKNKKEQFLNQRYMQFPKQML